MIGTSGMYRLTRLVVHNWDLHLVGLGLYLMSFYPIRSEDISAKSLADRAARSQDLGMHPTLPTQIGKGVRKSTPQNVGLILLASVPALIAGI